MPKIESKRGNWTLVRSAAELPNIDSVTEVFGDAETISGDPDRPASLPYSKGDRMVGFAFTVDDHPEGWYIPLRHAERGTTLFSGSGSNLPLPVAKRFLSDLLRDRDWINHNIKFDAHFGAADGVDVLGASRFIDTLTLAKLVDMQRRAHDSGGGGYGLKKLMREWLGDNTDEAEEVARELKRLKTKDRGDVDAEILGEYAVSDTKGNRKLYRHIVANRYEGDEFPWNLEIRLTRVLFKMEQRGLRVDLEAFARAREDSETALNETEGRLRELGVTVDVGSSSALHSLIFEDLSLPVVSRTPKGQPSIDKFAIALYLELPEVEADPRLKAIIAAIGEYRKHAQFINLYLNGWPKYIDPNGDIHPDFNQYVSTGRMSCLSPNFQQLNKEAKRLIVPRPGRSIISRDYSQVEYRIICSICREMEAIRAYNEDPNTDFHTFVAQLCGIDRKPAKNINFGIAFGMGEPELIRQLGRLIGGSDAHSRAEEILRKYHGKFRRIKRVANTATKVARERAGWRTGEYGYIKTLYGRRRALKYVSWDSREDESVGHDETRKAFNSTVQGTAAEIAKAQLCKVAESRILREAGVFPICIVHDEVASEGPTEAVRDPEIQREYERALLDIDIDLGLPLAVSGAETEKSWADA